MWKLLEYPHWKYLIFFFLVPEIIYSQKYSLPVSFDLNSFRIEKSDSFPSIHYPGYANYIKRSGYPELPYIPIYILLPHNSKINKIVANVIDSKHINDLDFANGEKKIVKTSTSIDFPSSDIIFESPELFAGFLIDKIYICPFRYFPETQQLFFCSKLLLDIQYLIEEKPLKYELSEDKIKTSREFLRDLVINKDEIDKTVPLEEKIDYSVIKINKETKEDTVDVKKKESILLKKEEKRESFHIKRLK